MSYGIYPKGIIYQRQKLKSQGEFVLRANFFVRFGYGFLRLFGAGLIGFFILSLLSYGFPLLKEEVLFHLHQKEIKIQRNGFGDLLQIVQAEQITRTKEEAASFNLNSYFSVVIPKIGATANIIPNVDPGNETEYLEALKKGVAHAKGTYFPGQGKTIYLFAHSTDSSFNVTKYNAVFFLLNKLEKDDQIIVFFLDQKYLYRVEKKLIIPANDTSFLTPKDQEELILQTCYPPGTSFERLLVFAKRI